MMDRRDKPCQDIYSPSWRQPYIQSRLDGLPTARVHSSQTTRTDNNKVICELRSIGKSSIYSGCLNIYRHCTFGPVVQRAAFGVWLATGSLSGLACSSIGVCDSAGIGRLIVNGTASKLLSVGLSSLLGSVLSATISKAPRLNMWPAI